MALSNNILDDFDNSLSINSLLKEININKYDSLIKEKVHLLHTIPRFPIKLFLHSDPDEILRHGIENKGKINWGNTPYKYPLNIRIDTLNLRGLDLLVVFLHECGHAEDCNDNNILIRSKQSEISAWNHAFESFIRCKPNNNELNIFYKIAEKSLQSYEIIIHEYSEFDAYKTIIEECKAHSRVS